MLKLDAENIPYLYFSQTGEDKLVLSYLEQISGYYVDVGAYDPITFSNTFAFYLRGLRGINIEPNPDAIPAFEHLRSEDKTINMGVSRNAQDLDYYSFNLPTFNTFNKDFAERILSNQSGLVQHSIRKIPTRPLTDILNEHAPQDQPFQLLSVDAEGMDLEVLQSLDWKKYRPEIVLVEDLAFEIEDPQSSVLFQFMKSQSYTLVAKTVSTLMFHENERFMKRKKI